MVTLISVPAARLSSALSRASALAMDLRVAVAERGASVPADSRALTEALRNAANAVESYRPESREELRSMADQALILAEQVRLLTADVSELEEAYEEFALEAEDLGLAAKYRRPTDLSGARPLSDF